MYEYLASVQSAVRRINQRMQTLADKFGANSSMLWNYKAEIDVLLPDNYRYKKGVIQISNPADIFGDEEKMKAVESLEQKVKTWGSLKKEYEKGYEKYVEEQKFFNSKVVDMPDFIQTMENIHHALEISDSEQLPQDALDILRVKDRRNTYDELNQVSEILKREGWI